MKTFKQILTLALAVALVAPLAPLANVEAQPVSALYPNPQSANAALGAVSTDVGLLLKYVGTSPAGGVVTVAAATGDITLETGVVGTVVADATTECPVSGALGGIIDVSDAACNTMGEVVDAINSSLNWRAVLIDARRDDPSTSTNGILITRAASSASDTKGVPLFKDTTEALNVSLVVVPAEYRSDIRLYLDQSQPPKRLNQPFNGMQSVLLRANGTFTGTGADFFDYTSIDLVIGSCPTATAAVAASIICTDSETYSSYTEPGGGTTVNKAYDFSEIGLPARKNAKALVRLRAATTFTAAVFAVGGFISPYRAQQR